MNRYSKYGYLIILPLFLTNSISAFAANSVAIVPILDLVLNSNTQSSKPPFPRRRDFGGNAVFSVVSDNLISQNVEGAQITYRYDAINRVSGFSVVNDSDPTSNIDTTFTYVSLTTERLEKIEFTSYSGFGTELNSQINFSYTAANQLNNFTNASFEGSIGSDIDEEEIFTISVNYEPIYENSRLTTINKEFTNDLPPPLGGSGSSTINIAYDNNTVIEIIDVAQEGGRAIGRRINLSPLRQEVVLQLVTSSGEVFFSNSEIANYEAKSCNASNRLLEENLLIFNLFLVPSLNALFQPELCRD